MRLKITLISFFGLLGLLEGPAEIACVVALVAALIGGDWRRWRPSVIEWGLLAWFISGYVGLALRSKGVHSEDALRPVLALAFVLAVRSIPRADDQTVRRMIYAFTFALVLNGAYGYLQIFIGELPLDRWLLKNKGAPQIWAPDRIGGVRCASGLYYNRLKLSAVGIVGLFGLVLLGLTPAFAGEVKTRMRRVAAVLGGLILAGALAATYARMAIAAFFAASFVVFLFALPRKIALAVSSALAVIAVGGIGAWAMFTEIGSERVAKIGEDFAIRGTIYDMAWTMFREHPLLGIGHGVYRTFAETVAPEGLDAALKTNAHNLLLHVLTESGVVGFAGFTIALTVAIVRVTRRIRRDVASTSSHALLDRMALFCLVAILLLGIPHFSLVHAPVAITFWFFFGVAGRTEEPLRKA